MKESQTAAGGSKAHVHAEQPERESGPEQMSGDQIAVAEEVSAVLRRPCSAAMQSTSVCGTFGLNRNFSWN